jgi:MFS family permease
VSDDLYRYQRSPIYNGSSRTTLVVFAAVTTIQAERLGGNFAKLWGASTTSALGAGLANVAVPLLVASRTHSPLVVALASVFIWLPWLLFSLPGGVIVDRSDRRRLMVMIDWVRVGVLAVLSATLLTGHTSIPLLYVALFIVNTGEVTFRSASQALVQSVVPRPLLERANGWLSGGTTFTASLIAGPIGGLLFVLMPSAPFVANAATYAVSAALIGSIPGAFRTSAAVATPEKATVWDDMLVGLRWLVRQRLLRTMAILIGLLNVTLTAALSVLVLLAKERLHLGPVGYGALFTSLAIGGVAGSIVGDRLIRLVSATWTIRIGLLIEAGLHLTLATSHSAYVVGLAFLIFGIHGALWSIVMVSLRQRLTPPELLGRVGSASLLLSAGGNCIGAVLGGALATRYGLAAPYWVGFVVAVIVAATTWHIFNRAAVAEAYATPPDR